MGSSEEEKLVQMVHDFMEPHSSLPKLSHASNTLRVKQKAHYSKLQDILRSEREEEREVEKSVKKYMRKKMETDESTGIKKWLVGCLQMDGFNASLCHRSWVTTFGCPAGEYEYIDITMNSENDESLRLIVDTDFKAQFEVARPTSTYIKLSETLPPIFIGDEDKLNKVISILCHAAQQSLIESGLHIPPWRTTTYMQSKWLSLPGKTATFGGAASKWVPPVTATAATARRKGFSGGSALYPLVPNMRINCC